ASNNGLSESCYYKVKGVFLSRLSKNPVMSSDRDKNILVFFWFVIPYRMAT
ncbi:15875_t:CDS:1, partial [Dentiscutata heterogama]